MVNGEGNYDAQREFEYALENNAIAHVNLTGAKVIAYIEGEHDGEDYHWFLVTPRNTYLYVWGGCDYTGWDCQSSLDASEEFTKENLNPNLLFPGSDNNNINVRDEMIKQLHDLLFSGKFVKTVKDE